MLQPERPNIPSHPFGEVNPFDWSPSIVIPQHTQHQMLGLIGIAELCSVLKIAVPLAEMRPSPKVYLAEGIPGLGYKQIEVESVNSNRLTAEGNLIVSNLTKSYQHDPICAHTITHQGKVDVQYDLGRAVYSFGNSMMEFALYSGSDPIASTWVRLDFQKTSKVISLEINLSTILGSFCLQHEQSKSGKSQIDIIANGESIRGLVKEDALKCLLAVVSPGEVASRAVSFFAHELRSDSLRSQLGQVVPNFEEALINSVPVALGRQFAGFFAMFE